MASERAGTWVQQLEGYRAFLPRPLPPEPGLALDAGLLRLLSDADRALGRLDGVTTTLPNPDLFVAMYVRHEAVLSSQIEGTQSTLEDVLAFEEGEDADLPRDVEEVVNYVGAMNHGLQRLPTLPLSNRLLREIHGRLLQGVRGSERSPGEFRTSQNWIGPLGCTLNTATFVPPPPHALGDALANLERYLHDHDAHPPLVQAGIAHAQFETIHPFNDGNGRVGRLLVTLFLCERGILQRPLLYLSSYLKTHRMQYYDRLTGIRLDGDWEGWLRFFLTGVAEVSVAATDTARRILVLRESARQANVSRQALRLADHLFQHPILTVRGAERLLECTYTTAGKALTELQAVGLVREVTGHRRNRRFQFDAYLRLFRDASVEPGLPTSPESLRTSTENDR